MPNLPRSVAAAALAVALLPVAAMAMEPKMHESALQAASPSGLPEGQTEESWTMASGEARVTAAEGGEAIVEVTASGLVPEGVYTIWWVTPQLVGMDMGPGGGTSANEVTADAEGRAATTITVPADNDYEMIVLAYHADGMTHGDGPGAMGEVTFEHLMGPWPGPAGDMGM